MSAAKMVADSTQDASDGNKKKKKIKKSGKKISLPEDEDSDLDLKKDLKPISSFSKDRPRMIEEMFHSVRGASLQRALPELLKSIPLDELKILCSEQLEVMSKKRIRRIFAGEESANISSSGTEDDSSEEENHQEPEEDKAQNLGQPSNKSEDGPVADSTSIHQECLPKIETETESEQVPAINEQSQQPTEFFPAVEVKQEPPDSESEAEEEYEPEPEEDDELEEEEEEEEEMEEEDPPEAYTSGSEDGELVKKDVLITNESGPIHIKQEVSSDTENPDQNSEKPMESQSDVNDDHLEAGAANKNVEDLEGELLSSVETSAGEPGSLVLPSIMMDQMELLELEMRARAIKAMLTSQEEEAEDG